jgi:hypothetical protein
MILAFWSGQAVAKISCQTPQMLRAFFLGLIGCVRSRRDLVLENLALRQQLAVLAARRPRPRLATHDRVFGHCATILARLDTCSSHCASRDRGSLASRRIQATTTPRLPHSMISVVRRIAPDRRQPLRAMSFNYNNLTTHNPKVVVQIHPRNHTNFPVDRRQR